MVEALPVAQVANQDQDQGSDDDYVEDAKEMEDEKRIEENENKVKKRNECTQFLITDREEFEKSLTEEEKAAYANFEDTLRDPEEEGEEDRRDEFQAEIDEAFAECDGGATGVLQKDEVKLFLTRMHENAERRGLRSQAPTDEWMDQAWPCFNNWKDTLIQEKDTRPGALEEQNLPTATNRGDGVTKEELLDVLSWAAM